MLMYADVCITYARIELAVEEEEDGRLINLNRALAEP